MQSPLGIKIKTKSSEHNNEKEDGSLDLATWNQRDLLKLSLDVCARLVLEK